MSLIYSILKPVLRKASAGRAAMTREDFVRQAEKKQRRNLSLWNSMILTGPFPNI